MPRRSGIVVRQRPLDLFGQRIGFGEVADADGAAADLVFGEAGPMPRLVVPILRPELAFSRSASSSRWTLQESAGVVGDPQQVRRDVDSLASQLCNSLRKGGGRTPRHCR